MCEQIERFGLCCGETVILFVCGWFEACRTLSNEMCHRDISFCSPVWSACGGLAQRSGRCEFVVHEGESGKVNSWALRALKGMPVVDTTHSQRQNTFEVLHDSGPLTHHMTNI